MAAKPASPAQQRAYLLALKVATAEQRLRREAAKAQEAELACIFANYKVQLARAQFNAATELESATELPPISGGGKAN